MRSYTLPSLHSFHTCKQCNYLRNYPYTYIYLFIRPYQISPRLFPFFVHLSYLLVPNHKTNQLYAKKLIFSNFITVNISKFLGTGSSEIVI